MKCPTFISDFLKLSQPIPREKKFGLNVCLNQLCSCAVHLPSSYGPRTARECFVPTKMLLTTSQQTAAHVLLIHKRTVISRSNFHHQQSLSSFFSKDGKLVYCNDVEGLLQELACTHNHEEWRLFVDLSKFSSKALLLT